MYLTREQHFAHFGKKGMRWGVRNDKPSPVTGTVPAARKHTIGSAIKTTGKVLIKTGIAVAATTVAGSALLALKMESEYPGFIQIGKDGARATLDQFGLMNLNTMDKVEIIGRRMAFDIKYGAVNLDE